jgi:putative membrane protein
MMPSDTLDTRQKRIRRLNVYAWIFTVIVWLLVGAMRQVKIKTDLNLDFLAGLNALFNTGVAMALIAAYIFIKRGRQETYHRRSIYVAMILSAGFLLSYVGYHFTHEEIPFCKEGAIRVLYYLILFSHIALAGVSLPFILMAFIRGYTGDYVTHKKMVKWVYPVWLYVAVTGPMVYLFLLPCR